MCKLSMIESVDRVLGVLLEIRLMQKKFTVSQPIRIALLLIQIS